VSTGPASGAAARRAISWMPDNAAATRVLFGVFAIGLAGSVTLTQGALIGLTALWLWRLRDPAARRAQRWPLRWPVLAFLASTLVSALASGSPGTSLLATKGLFVVLALYITLDILDTTDRAERFVVALTVLTSLAALAGLVQVLACPGAPPAEWPLSRFFSRCDRARGPFSIYMTLGGVLATVLLAGLPRLLPGGAGPRWLAGPWLVMLAGLAATYVRGAWLGFGAGLMVVLGTMRRGRVLLVAGLVLLVLGVLLGPERLSQRLRSISDPQEVTIRERLYMWRSGFAMWREHPWLGVGPGGVGYLYSRYALPEAIKKRTGHLHSSPLQILVEGGVVGLAAWLWIWLAFFWSGWRALRVLAGPGETRERALCVGGLAAVAGFLVTGLSEWSFGDDEVVTIAWALAALPFAAQRTLATRSPTPSPGEGGSGDYPRMRS
jgi:putative inorganic carbon (hco3(-)) transporter